MTEPLGFQEKELVLKRKELALKNEGEVTTGSGSSEKSSGSKTQSPSTPPVASAPPSPPASSQVDREALPKKVIVIQAKAKQRREEAEANREKCLQNLTEIKGYLVEALAKHGDSLTTVKPGEYINLVLADSRLGVDSALGVDGQKARYDVISVQKSWITDYKAARLSLDGFKQKVLQYAE